MPALKKPRTSKYSTTISATWYRTSGINMNEDGSHRFDVDFYVDEQAYLDGDQPLDSEQYNEIPLALVTLNTLDDALVANSDVDL